MSRCNKKNQRRMMEKCKLTIVLARIYCYPFECQPKDLFKFLAIWFTPEISTLFTLVRICQGQGFSSSFSYHFFIPHDGWQGYPGDGTLEK